MKVCPGCGSAVPDGANWCPNCGEAAGGGKNQLRTPQKNSLRPPQQNSFGAPKQNGFQPPRQNSLKAPQKTGFETPQKGSFKAPQTRSESAFRAPPVVTPPVVTPPVVTPPVVTPPPVLPDPPRKKRHRALPWILVLVVLLAAGGLYLLGRSKTAAAVEEALRTRIQAEVIAGDDLPLYIQYRNAVLESIAYEADSVQVFGSAAGVRVSYPDVPALLRQLAPEAPDAGTFYQRCIDAIRDGTAPRRQEALTLRYTGGAPLQALIGRVPQLNAVDDEALLTVLTGGGLTEYRSLISGEEGR